MYGDAGAYGGLAGFSGPALGGATAPVVRYQDLMRTSAPASAGVPEFGRIVTDADAGYGAEPLPLPVEQTMLGAFGGFGGFGYAGPTYEDLKGYPELKRGSSDTAKVKELQDALVKKGLMTQEDLKGGYGTFGAKTEAAVKTANTRASAGGASDDGVVHLATWAYLLDVAPSTVREDAEKKDKGNKKEQSSDEPSALQQIIIGAAKRTGFITSGADEKPKEEVSKDGDQTGTDWGKIALIGGGVLVGITSIVLITRALSSKE